jgi:hypothetical protein
MVAVSISDAPPSHSYGVAFIWLNIDYESLAYSFSMLSMP